MNNQSLPLSTCQQLFEKYFITCSNLRDVDVFNRNSDKDNAKIIVDLLNSVYGQGVFQQVTSGVLLKKLYITQRQEIIIEFIYYVNSSPTPSEGKNRPLTFASKKKKKKHQYIWVDFGPEQFSKK